MKNLITFTFLLFAVNSMALTISPGGILTLGTTYINEDIIVSKNATLIINGDVHMGDPADPTSLKYIIVKDRGQVISDGGSLIGYDPTSFNCWGGIIVEATPFPESVPFPALDLKNFAIENAQTAISMPRYREAIAGEPVPFELVNRSISVENTTFDKNVNYFRFNHDPLYASSYWTNFNITNGTYMVSFVDCQFLSANGTWPFWIVKDRNIDIKNCLFNSGSSSGVNLGVHVNNVTNLTISGSEFKHTGSAGIIFHGSENDDIVISNNQFSFSSSDPYSSGYAGIAVGYTTNTGGIKNVNITDNVFTGVSNIHAYGIVVGIGTDTPPIGGNAGYIHTGTIDRNQFDGFRYPISLTGDPAFESAYDALGLGNQDILLSENRMVNYQYGLSLGYRSHGIEVTCNRFGAGYNGFRIVDYLTTVQDWTGGDHANRFTLHPLHINNETTSAFTFDKSPSNSAPATAFAGPVNVVLSSSMMFCLPKSLSANDEMIDVAEDKVNLFPNPVESMLNLEASASYHSFTIVDISGKELASGLLTDGRASLDVSELKSGAYVVEFYSNNGIKREKLIVR